MTSLHCSQHLAVGNVLDHHRAAELFSADAHAVVVVTDTYKIGCLECGTVELVRTRWQAHFDLPALPPPTIRQALGILRFALRNFVQFRRPGAAAKNQPQPAGASAKAGTNKEQQP